MPTRGRELLQRARRRASRWAPWALAALGMLWLMPPLWVDWHVDHGFDSLYCYSLVAGLGRGTPYGSCGAFAGGLQNEDALEDATAALLLASAVIVLLAVAAGGRRRAWTPILPHRVLWVVPPTTLLLAGVCAAVTGRMHRAEEMVDWLRDAAPWSWLTLLIAPTLFLPTRRTLALDDRGLTARLSMRATGLLVWLAVITPRSDMRSWWVVGAGGLAWLLLLPVGLALAVAAARAARHGPRWSLLPLVGLAAWLVWWMTDQGVAVWAQRLVPPDADALQGARLRDLALLARFVDVLGALPWLSWTFGLARSLRDQHDRTGLRATMRPLLPLLPVLALLPSPAIDPDPLFAPSLDRAYEVLTDFQPIERPSDAHSLGLRAGVDRVAAITGAGDLVWLGSEPPENPNTRVTLFPDARVTTTQFLDVVATLSSRSLSIGWVDPARPDVGTAAERWPVVRQRLRMVCVAYLDDPRDTALHLPPDLPEGLLLRDQLDAIARAEVHVNVRGRASVDVPTRRVNAGVPWDEDIVPFGAPWWVLGAVLGVLLGLARWPHRRAPRLRPASPYRAPAPRAVRARPAPSISTRVLRRGLVTASRLVLLALACGVLGTVIGWLVLAPFGASH